MLDVLIKVSRSETFLLCFKLLLCLVAVGDLRQLRVKRTRPSETSEKP